MRKFYLLALFLGISSVALAQESSCSDGVDNDGDGFIDCFDGDCANNMVCDESYIGKDKLCQIAPSGTLSFGMRLGATSRDRTTLSYGRMAVGDLDRDGTPEMVTTHHNDKKVFILNGDDLTIKTEINTIGSPEYFDHAIANLDNDNCAEIFIVESEVRRVCDSRGRNCNNVTFYFVTSFDCNGAQLWRTQIYDQPFTIGLADFDHDGNVELYYKNEILDAKTGEILVAGSGNWDTMDSGPVAVDLLPDAACGECAGLELVLGGVIHAVDLDPRTPGGGSVGTPVRRFNDLPGLGGITYFPKYVSFGYVNSMTSIADYNLDGNLDVIMNGATSASATSTTTVFFWDVYNNTFKTFQPRQPNGSSWPHGTGRINLADIDGDGKMNATFVSGARIYALKEDFTLLWQKTITEQTSGFTSTTVFDFNNDNAVEIVYRDERNLYIIDGKTGNAFTTVPCRSRTANDYPIVVDVDADGATEICVSCSSNDNADINNNGNTPFGQIRTFKSSLEPWVSARKVWNQYAYFNVNINDDLTVPQVQQKHHLVFSEDVCGTGENRALNSFLNQSAILDSKGCKTYPSADVAFVANPSLLNVTPPLCPDKDFVVSFSLQNVGDLDLNGDFPITFYNGDPRLAGAVKLRTEIIKFSDFRIGDQLDIPDLTVSGTGGPFTLFAVLNDNGSTVPTPISLPNSGFGECDFSNNIVSASVNPRAFQLSAAATDHIQCGAGASTPNGTLRVFKPEGATEQTVGYSFYWFDGSTAGPPGAADFSGSVRTGVTNGTYTVYAMHDAYQCGSDTVQVPVGLQTRSIGATVNVVQPYTNCNSPDGALSVIPDGGQPLSNYTFEWFEGTVFGTSPTLSDSSVLRLAGAKTYSVLVTEKSSKCETLESGTVPDLTVSPSVTATATPANCMPANSGQVTATVGGVTAGYSFYWYNGSTSKPSENYLGHTYSNVPQGNYTVIVQDNVTGCRSNETVVTVGSATGITVTASVTAQQTSCAAPNGSASANVGGATAGYTFRWFKGNNTTDFLSTGATITALAAGQYTVQATNIATGCVDTELITVADNILLPSVTATVKSHQTACFPPDGAVSATAAGSSGPHQYYWFNGNIGTPDTTTANFRGPEYPGLSAGYYTIVAVDRISRCASTRSVVEVLDQTITPVIVTTPTAQTGCDIANPNGQASANVGGVTTGYDFRWFRGGDTTTFITQSPTLASAAAGTYTVKAINRRTGCFATKVVVVNDVSAKPVIKLSSTENVNCSSTIGYTGSVTASFELNPNVQSGHQLVYQWTRNGVILPDETTATVSGVGAGTYGVTVSNQNLACVSDPVSIQVSDVTVLPDVITSSTPSTNCVAGLENGTAAVVSVDNIAAGAADDYSYQWHTGAGTASPIATTTNSTADDAILRNIQGGTGINYTVRVTNMLTGCASTAIVNVGDAKSLPELALVATPNTICDPGRTSPFTQFNGTVTANVDNQVGSLADYTFAFAGGAGTQGLAPAHNVLHGLNGGITYTATATNTLTGCASAPASITVLNNQDVPDLVMASDPSTNCIAGREDGSASVISIDGAGVPGSGFTFAWTGPALFDVSANATINSSQLQDVQGGTGYDYTVLVTNQSNGCQRTAVVNVADKKQTPALILTSQPNSICDPARATLGPGTFNGSVLANISATGNYTGSVVADFSFNWNTGFAGKGQNLLTSLDVGTYSVTAVHETTGCESSPASAQVLSAKELPAISVASTPSRNCDGGAPDGNVSVTDILPNGLTYDYRWFDGNTTSGTPGPILLNTTSTSSVYNNVQGGLDGISLYEYTVEVTILQTGCVSTATVGVDDDSEVPVLGPLASTNNTLCSFAKNGTATVSTLSYRGGLIAPADYDDFVFMWSGGTQGPETTISGLAPGTYTLTVAHKDDNCTSNPVALTIVDDLFYPQIEINAVDQTSCDPMTPNGSLAATIDETPVGGTTGTTTGYTFSWVDDITSNTTVSNAIANLKGKQTYTVTAVNSITECSATQSVFLNESLVSPVVGVTVTDVTICAPANGALVATDLPGHVYYWYNGADAIDENAVIAGADYTGGSAYASLIPGDYTLVVQNTATTCKSQQMIRTVADATPVINPVVSNTLIPVDCNTTGGTLDGAVQFINADFAALAATNELTTSAPLSGLAVGDQVIIGRNGAISLPSGLEEDKVYFVQSIDGTRTVLKLSQVAGGPEIDVTADGTGTIGDFVTAGYNYEWFRGVPNPTDPALGSINFFTNPPLYTGGSLSIVQTVTGIETGVYTVQVTDQATGCKNYLSHTLPFIGSHAVIKINKINSTICPTTVGNGSIEIQIENPAGAPVGTDQNDYEVTLIKGATNLVGPYSPGAGYEVNPFIISNTLAPGSYVVEVTETYTGFDCAILQEVIISADAQPPVISLAGPIADNTACTPAAFDGRIDINVAKDPNDRTGAGITYDILMAPDPNAAFPLLAQPLGNVSAVNLGAGSYSFTVNASNGCSAVKTFSVLDDPMRSELTSSNLSVTPAEYCDVSLEQSARVVINNINRAGGGPENLGDYRFDWYTDATLSTHIYGGPADPSAVKGGEELSNNGAAPFLPVQPVTSGTYRVVATKIADTGGTGGRGCSSSPYTVNIGSAKVLPGITLTPRGDTSCDPGVFEGSLQIDVVTASGPGASALYSYNWTPTGAAGEPASSVGNDGVADVISNINDGVYQLTALNQVTGCTASLASTIRKEAPPLFTLDAVDSDLTDCAVFNGKIDGLQMTVSGLTGNVGDFDYVWYRSDLSPSSIVLDGTNSAVAVDEELTLTTYPLIGVDQYFIKAIRKAGGAGVGCASTPIKRTIEDLRVFPRLSFETVANTACDDHYDGRITITANTPSGPGAGANYNFVWTNDPDGLGGPLFRASNAPDNNTPSPFSTLSTDLVGEGIYSIRVTNFVTQCYTDGTVTVGKQAIPMEIVSITPDHVDVCSLPQNGGGTITGLRLNNMPANTADFTYTWADNAGMTAPFVTNDPSLTQAGLSIGTYFVVARRNAVNSPLNPGVSGSGCATAPSSLTVQDLRVYPVINFATQGSTACDNEFDGQITVAATTAGFDPATTTYDFTWTSSPGGGVVISDRLGAVSAPVFRSEALGGPVNERIGPGTYAITVTNNTTQCAANGMVVLQRNTMPVEIMTATATPQQLCTTPGDGSVTVALSDVRVGGNPVASGVTFNWTDNNGNSLGTGTSITDLAAGFYNVEATRTSGSGPASGCVSAPLKVEVKDGRKFPVIAFTTVANTTCNDDFDAQITVIASTPSGPGAGANYHYDWKNTPGGMVSVADAVDIASPYTTGSADNIGAGTYTITVMNQITQCASDASVTVSQNTVPIQLLDISKTDQTDCAPFNASITIDSSNPSHVSHPGDYTFAWEKGGAVLSPGPGNMLSGAEAGVYTITATKTSGIAAGCSTDPLRVTLRDLTHRPVLELQAVANFACEPALSNGALSAVIFENGIPANAADFSLAWYAGNSTTSGAVLGNAEVLSGRQQGDYTLLAVDNVSPNRGCRNMATRPIGFDETSFSLTVASTHQDLCPPLQNGGVSVTGITEVRNGISTPGNLKMYGFQWVDNNGIPHASTPDYVNGLNAVDDLVAGEYRVRVRNALGCISTETTGVIEDLTVLPAITLNNFVNPQVCVLPEVSGYLQVSADNSLNFGDYRFEWFEGPDATGTLVEPNNATLANIAYNQPMEYTVRVTNIATGCMSLDTYRMRTDTIAVQVLASAAARTNCLVDDGSLFATTLNGGGALYDYAWYAGTVATGIPVYTSKDVQGVPVGQYTVVAINPNHSFCASKPYTTRVPDARALPDVVAMPKNPLTYCDPVNPNGVAFAHVNNEVNGYVFDWFKGSVNGTPLYTGSEMSGLTATTYVVRATDVRTGCENTAAITVENDPVNVPEPTVVVISHHTNCAVPDGILSASVDGNTADYFLKWYDGNTVKSLHDASGEFYRALPDGYYAVTATDLESGCVSDPVVAQVLPFQELPEFDVKTVPTNCEQNVGEAKLVLLNDVQLISVEWNIDGSVEYGTMLSGLPKGEFTVSATTYQECVTTRTFTILPEVLVFNGVSRNNDGQNDFFEIACIQDYPNNNVKIFNRAGTLVYEANGYDNRDVFFNGVSNRGISLLGTDLPDGTYFYIIDKRDGSEPGTGYLELLR